jgi:putative transposase
MTAPHILDPARLLDQALSDASPDLMRRLLSTVINALLSAEADAVCGAEWGQPSAERVNQRNGYRHRELDTRVGTVDMAVPKLRHVRADSKKEISSLAMGSGSSSGAK